MAGYIMADSGLGFISIAVGTTLGGIILATIVGNILVVVAVSSNKVLHTVSNIFIVSLSLADLLVGTVVMIPAMLNEIYGRWILAPEFCSIWVSFDVMLTSASILNVSLISLDRYLVIMRPLRYKSLMSTTKALVLLSVIWFIAIMASFLPIENGWHYTEVASLQNLTANSDTPQCVFVVSLPFAATVSSVTILLPILISFTLYYRISKEANRQFCLLRMLATPGNVLLGMQKVSSKTVREPFTRKATVTLGIIVGAYVFTWAPFLTANIVEVFCRCVPPKVFKVFVWLGYCNSLVNPIIYPLFMRDFRKVYFGFLFFCFPFLKTLKKYERGRSERHVNVPIK